MEKTQRDAAFDTQIGQKAIVEHHKIADSDPYMHQLREVLGDIGRDMLVKQIVPPSMEYVGSLSVHIYKGGLSNFAFVGLTNGAHLMPWNLADAALKKMRFDVQEIVKGTRAKLRSGF